MKRAILIVAVGCGHGMSPPEMGDDDDGDVIILDAPRAFACPNGHSDKIKFEEASGCLNDGSVEFCIPDSDPQLRDALDAISPAINCVVGGGRAQCLRAPGLLLCSYPTAFPAECVARHGAMTEEVWADMCELAGQPSIFEIVPTFAR